MENFENSPHFKEIVLRGAYLSMAVDVEWILSDLFFLPIYCSYGAEK